MPSSVDRFLELVLAQRGAPYIWGGKGETVKGERHNYRNAAGQPQLVFDCSGLITWALRQAGWKPVGEYNAHRMWKNFPRVDKPQAGDIICYGTPEKANHVEVMLADGRAFGSIGGDSRTTAPTPGKGVAYRTRPRRDVLGYVRNPLRGNDAG